MKYHLIWNRRNGNFRVWINNVMWQKIHSNKRCGEITFLCWSFRKGGGRVFKQHGREEGQREEQPCKVEPRPFITCVSDSGPKGVWAHTFYPWMCILAPVLWDKFLFWHDSSSLVRWLPTTCTHHQDDRWHYSSPNQEPEKNNVSCKTTHVLITDTLSRAYWLGPGGISEISWICRMERWNEHRLNGEWETFKDIWIQRAVL